MAGLLRPRSSRIPHHIICTSSATDSWRRDRRASWARKRSDHKRMSLMNLGCKMNLVNSGKCVTIVPHMILNIAIFIKSCYSKQTHPQYRPLHLQMLRRNETPTNHSSVPATQAKGTVNAKGSRIKPKSSWYGRLFISPFTKDSAIPAIGLYVYLFLRW